MSTGTSSGVPGTFAPAGVKSKVISLRKFQSLFHQAARLAVGKHTRNRNATTSLCKIRISHSALGVWQQSRAHVRKKSMETRRDVFVTVVGVCMRQAAEEIALSRLTAC